MVSRMLRAADTPNDIRNNGDQWHTDRSHDACPLKGFVLYCEEAPDYGGDTLFASLCQAYDGLLASLQQKCRQRTGIHTMAGLFDEHKFGRKRDLAREPFGNNEAYLAHIHKQTEHPLVCRHSDSGRPFLFVIGPY